MATQETSWILNLIDKVSKPIEDIIDKTNQWVKNVAHVEKSNKRSQGEIQSALQRTKYEHAQVGKEITKQSAKVKKFENLLKSVKDQYLREGYQKGLEREQGILDKLIQKHKELESAISGMNKELEKSQNSVNKFSWTAFTVKLNQTLEVIDKVSKSLDFATEYQSLKKNVSRMTDLTGAALTSYTKDASRIADVYLQDADEIAKAVNTLTQQVGGSYEDNFALIEKGFKIGADVNGNYINNLQEYAAKFREAGLEASEGIALITAANKKGIDPSKALDFLAEGTINLKDLGKKQKEALSGIGIKLEDLIGNSPIDAIKIISEKMKGESAEAKQAVIKSIFKGMGKDAGVLFAEEISEIDFDISNYTEVKEAGEGMRSFFSSIKSFAAESLGDIPQYIQELAPVATVIGTIISLTKEWAMVQKVLNLIMSINPIGLIVIAVAALITYIGIAISYWDDFGAAMMVLLGPIGLVISAFKSIYDHWDSIKKAFKDGGIIGAIKRLKEVLIDAFLKPLQQALEVIAKFDPTGLAQKGVDAIKAYREENDLVTEGEKEKEIEKEKSLSDLSVNKIVRGEPALDKNKIDDRKIKPTSNEKTNGLAISGKSGAANIKMTINNYFNVGSGTNIRQLADQVAGRISDRLQDAIVSV